MSRRGVHVVVCFWSHAANELKEAATEFISLNQHVDQLRRSIIHEENSHEMGRQNNCC
jgi:hypothetical protein